MMHRRIAWAAAMICMAMSAVGAQTPQPFPRGGAPASSSPQQPASSAPPQPVTAAAQPGTSVDPSAPTEAQLGFPIYPTSQYLASYDAGRGQRYYLFGSTASFTEMVTYYRSTLRERGTLVFEEPPTHMFEVGRYREETMAFPPGVTIKDYTWGSSAGFPNPKRGVVPERFLTIIQIVPAPAAPGTPARR